jgi:hypothetical protein
MDIMNVKGEMVTAVKTRLDKTWAEDGNIMTAAFIGYDVDSKRIGKVPGVAEIRFDRRLASAENRDHAERHGWEQKIGDAAAIQRDTKSGKSASLEDKLSAMAEVAERLQLADGGWDAKGTRGAQSAETLLAKLAAMGVDVSSVVLK